MPSHSVHLAKPSLAYAKLVATPSDISWAQAYNAGNLFVTVALEKPVEEEGLLQALGKELFSHLESEFFTLEKKNLETIKQALSDSLKDVPPFVTVDLTLAYVLDDILYLFIYGAGKVVMKREEKIGVLLEKTHEGGHAVLSASGFLQNNDTFILQTKQFVKSISSEMLIKALELELPNDIAETLSPQIHETDNGGEAAIIITYHGVRKTHEDDLLMDTPESLEQTSEDEAPSYIPKTPHTYVREGNEFHEAESPSETIDEDETLQEKPSRLLFLKKFHMKLPKIKTPKALHLSHTKKLFISIIVIIIALLVVSIFYFKKNQKTQQLQTLFSKIYPPAQTDYQNGTALEVLNLIKAHGDFLQAQSLLESGENKFPPDSSQHAQIASLLQNVQTQLAKTSNSNFITPLPATVSSTDMLSVEKNTPSGLAFGQDDQNIYYITSNEVIAVDKTSGNKKTIITNNNDWTTPLSIVPYEGNIYILDRSKGVLKYVAGAGGFGESSYFKNQAPDLSSSRSMAIDGNVWILFQDGSLLEYTKGQADDFQISGLDQPFTNPTKLFTDLTTASIYILDRGNARIVLLDKTGKYESSYASSIIQTATDFEVMESEQKILILSNGSIWQIPLK